MIALSSFVLVLTYLLFTLRTSPSLNILLYNAIGGSGDELYGVEPASYYLRNLFLNLGVAWPIALVSPVVLGAEVLLTKCTTGFWPLARKTEAFWKAVMLFSLPLLWLGVLFSRPHKVTHHQLQCYYIESSIRPS